MHRTAICRQAHDSPVLHYLTVLHYALCGATLYGVISYGAALYGATLYGATLYSAISCGATLYGAISYGAIHVCSSPPDGDLCGHEPLPLCHHEAARALAVPPAAQPLVPLEARHHTVQPTSCALWAAAAPVVGAHPSGGETVAGEEIIL